MRNRHYWERSYLGHVYRDHRDREIGRVTRLGRPAEHYLWRTAGCRGVVSTLRLARALVEEAVRLNVHQVDLFEPSGTDDQEFEV